jgi:hypothetical protein
MFICMDIYTYICIYIYLYTHIYTNVGSCLQYHLEETIEADPHVLEVITTEKMMTMVMVDYNEHDKYDDDFYFHVFY